MAQQKFDVLYKDGKKLRVLCTPNALWDAEELFNGVNDTRAMRAQLFIAWASLRDAGMEPADFESWRKEKVAWVEQLDDEAVTAEDVDPTVPAPTDTSSPG
jgi:hypothetical protein